MIEKKTVQEIAAMDVHERTEYMRKISNEAEEAYLNKALNKTPKDCNIRIRKLTPKECWRLMGFDDESFERAEAVNSNTQLYKQAGNSIVVPVLEAIFKEML